MASQVILLEDGWNKLKSGGVNKIEAILEDMHGGVYKDKISTEEYSALYTCVARPACAPRDAARAYTRRGRGRLMRGPSPLGARVLALLSVRRTT